MWSRTRPGRGGQTKLEVVCHISASEGEVDDDGNVREAHEGDDAVPQAAVPNQALAQRVEESQKRGLDHPEAGPEADHAGEALLHEKFGLGNKDLQALQCGWGRELPRSDADDIEDVAVPDGVKRGQCNEHDIGEDGEQVIELETAMVPDSKEAAEGYEAGCETNAGPDDSLGGSTRSCVFG